MSFVKRNYIDGETVITAENLNDIQDAIIQIVPDDVKQALLQIASKVAYIDEHGQDYYDALEAALYPDASLVSISAVYTQSGTVYDTDSLDSLKADLVVTAHFDDSSTEVVTAYTLSGTLEVGTSTITVAYGGKTTTFNVTVSEEPWDVDWDYSMGNPSNYGIASEGTFSAENGAVLTLTGGGSKVLHCDPEFTANNGEAEIEFKVLTMSTAFQGCVFTFSTGTQGFRVRAYNNGLYWGTSANTSATDVKIADITTNTVYKLTTRWSADGVTILLDDNEIHTGTFTSTSARFIITQVNKGSMAIQSLRLRGVA